MQKGKKRVLKKNLEPKKPTLSSFTFIQEAKTNFTVGN
jgi:hypothetical protein